MTTDSPITEVKGVGEAVARKLAIVGIKTIADLIDYYPKRYEDYSNIVPISLLKPGPVSIEAEIKQVSGRYVRRGMHITDAIASDESGSLRLIWFNQPYREASLKTKQKYFISGQFELSRQKFVIMNPSLEMASDLPVNAARILAVYRETKGLKSRQIRLIIKSVIKFIENLEETLPQWIIDKHELINRNQAIATLHMPSSTPDLDVARRRLGFEEVFHLTLASLLNKLEIQSENAQPIVFYEKLAKDFVIQLPFKLTDAQRKAAWQIYQDMERHEPMNRLLEGDVGSGKTVVATMAALMALEQGWQVALMAPTELLARQHAETIYKLLKPLDKADEALLLVGSMNAKQKTAAHSAISSGKAKFIIGTQALIQEKVNMDKLALIIIDEQHRFGVEQRKTLMAKAGHMPHVLSLTATPIPRSLALTLYGELDISLLDSKPLGRQEILTEIISPNSRKQIYQKIEQELDQGRQMFVVCPVIEESSVLEASSVEKVYKDLTEHAFKHRKIALLHGRMKAEEKQQIMSDYVSGKTEILVSTTVIEVGVDVPNASIMMIESPERFGLAQLHQLRGRVGRSDQKGYCYLMTDDSNPPSRRLRALESSNDGFRLAELDLEIRGPGAIYGTMQHGQLDLRIAKLTDIKLIAEARACAQDFVDRGENLLQYKQLANYVNRLRAVTNLN